MISMTHPGFLMMMTQSSAFSHYFDIRIEWKAFSLHCEVVLLTLSQTWQKIWTIFWTVHWLIQIDLAPNQNLKDQMMCPLHSIYQHHQWMKAQPSLVVPSPRKSLLLSQSHHMIHTHSLSIANSMPTGYTNPQSSPYTYIPSINNLPNSEMPHLINMRHRRKTILSLLPLKNIFTMMICDIYCSFSFL